MNKVFASNNASLYICACSTTTHSFIYLLYSSNVGNLVLQKKSGKGEKFHDLNYQTSSYLISNVYSLPGSHSNKMYYIKP